MFISCDVEVVANCEFGENLLIDSHTWSEKLISVHPVHSF